MSPPAAIAANVVPEGPAGSDVASLRFGVMDGDGAIRWRCRRNCSASPRQVLRAYGLLCVASLTVATAFTALGAAYVLPFATIELLAVGIAMLVWARHAGDGELLIWQHRRLTVETQLGTGRRRVELAGDWWRVGSADNGRTWIVRSSAGSEAQFGRYLRADLRPLLADELRRVLRAGSSSA